MFKCILTFFYLSDLKEPDIVEDLAAKFVKEPPHKDVALNQTELETSRHSGEDRKGENNHQLNRDSSSATKTVSTPKQLAIEKGVDPK